MSLLNKYFVCVFIVEVCLVLNELLASPLVGGRDQRKVSGDSSSTYINVACTSKELNEFRIEYEKCHEKAVGMIEEQREITKQNSTLSISNDDRSSSQQLESHDGLFPNRTVVCVALRTLVEDCTDILRYCYNPKQVDDTKKKQKLLMNQAIKKIMPGLNLEEDCSLHAIEKTPVVPKTSHNIDDDVEFHPLQFGLSSANVESTTSADVTLTTIGPSGANMISSSTEVGSISKPNSIVSRTTIPSSASKIPQAFVQASPSTIRPLQSPVTLSSFTKSIPMEGVSTTTTQHSTTTAARSTSLGTSDEVDVSTMPFPKFASAPNDLINTTTTVSSSSTTNKVSKTTVEKESLEVGGTVRSATTTTTTQTTITFKIGTSATTATTTITADTRNISETITLEKGNVPTSIKAPELPGTSSSSIYPEILATSTLPTDASSDATIKSELQSNVIGQNSEELQRDNVTYKENQIASDGRDIPLVGVKFGQNPVHDKQGKSLPSPVIARTTMTVQKEQILVTDEPTASSTSNTRVLDGSKNTPAIASPIHQNIQTTNDQINGAKNFKTECYNVFLTVSLSKMLLYLTS